MALKLDDLIKKAKDKGYNLNAPSPSLPKDSEVLRTWQQESVLYSKENITNAQENQKKLRTKLGQTEDKVRTQLRTNLGQSEDNAKQNLRQTEDKVRTQLRTKLRTNLGQSEDKTLVLGHFSSLIGLQRKITLFMYETCKVSRSKITNALSIEHIANVCQTTKFSVRKTIQRLEEKKIISRNNFKNGRGGWTQYELADVVFKEIMQEETQEKLRINLGQSEDKVRPQLRTELRTNALSSSSNISINTTTTTELPNEWSKIDISLLEAIGFTTSHLLQLYRSGINQVEQVQDSINHFAYDLGHNQKEKEIKTNPLSYFMGIMKRVGVYAAPENYESEKDRALRTYMEAKKRQQEKQATMEIEMIEISYNEWISELTEDEKKSLLPEHALSNKLEGPKIAALKTYFKKNIWPNKKNEINQQLVD